MNDLSIKNINEILKRKKKQWYHNKVVYNIGVIKIII
jgi:hypothetical protein